jgi:hypothetical protein
MDARCSSASQNGKCARPAAGTACPGHATAQQHTRLRNKGSFKGLAAASQPAAAPQQCHRLAHKASPFSSHRQTDTCMHACLHTAQAGSTEYHVRLHGMPRRTASPVHLQSTAEHKLSTYDCAHSTAWGEEARCTSTGADNLHTHIACAPGGTHCAHVPTPSMHHLIQYSRHSRWATPAGRQERRQPSKQTRHAAACKTYIQ